MLNSLGLFCWRVPWLRWIVHWYVLKYCARETIKLTRYHDTANCMTWSAASTRVYTVYGPAQLGKNIAIRLSLGEWLVVEE